MEQIIATLSIWIKGRETASYDLNKILTQNSNLVLARMGYNIAPTCSQDCLAVITVVVRGAKEEIQKLNDEISLNQGLKSQVCFLSE